MVASSVVLTVVVLNYHHRTADIHEMPQWVKTICWGQSVVHKLSQAWDEISIVFPSYKVKIEELCVYVCESLLNPVSFLRMKYKWERPC